MPGGFFLQRFPLLLLLVVAAAAPVVVAPQTTPARSAPPVPPSYAGLYELLDARLRLIEEAVNARGAAGRDVIFAAELLPANANIGEALFREQTWPLVLLYLDRLQRLGVRGVKVAVKYPVLLSGFPRAAEYLQSYRRLGEELRRRNVRFLAQMTDGFRPSAFSALPVEPYYAGLTWERYRREKRQMAETVIREVRPDYLTVQNEPGTQAQNTGLPMTVQHTTDLLEYVTRGLDARGTLVGAGAGTWEDLAYAQALARIVGLDYLDMHIYPITRDYVVDRAFRFADIARRAGKRLVLGEAWLYKASDQDLRTGSVAAAPALFARDVFSFWEPLDARFVAAMVRFSQVAGTDFTSFFWSRYFFGYVDYSEERARLSPGELSRLANAAAARNLAADPPGLTYTGATLQRLLTR
ncbi:MAG: hypothetical protein QN152_04230 [Armatimonadota bacterium]|nr:hypothetical protein [Armatimonadota bacterium]MDR7426366.1 hypothetical protein [Armatimonadota bacterium]MDR7463336.1 hypothetical protein [Armatimonadota bacterium]MDR7469150.1 hypothetical protein [Armatimonadota bacterium]MDR7474579.1 hypothetical protein [Armatimonadota bacterium]